MCKYFWDHFHYLIRPTGLYKRIDRKEPEKRVQAKYLPLRNPAHCSYLNPGLQHKNGWTGIFVLPDWKYSDCSEKQPVTRHRIVPLKHLTGLFRFCKYLYRV